jgi:hypothetical protein
VADNGKRQRKPGFKTAVEDAKAVATVLAMAAESIFGRRPAQVLGVLTLFAVVIGLVLTFLNWYIDPGNARERKDLILTSAQVLGGTALLSGLYFTWRTLQVNHGGQITERFTRAVDQLGASEGDVKKVETRMGEIYALERIAKQSAEDYWPIMEILAAYVQQHAPLQTAADSEANQIGVESLRFGHKDPDVQTCLTVIGRRYRDRSEEPKRLNLERTDLSFADLARGNFTRVWFARANLRRANLPRVDLREASLRRADLWGAYLKGAKLSRADFLQANLKRTNLKEANLRGTFLEGADLATVRNLTQDQVNLANGDQDTTLPPGLERPRHWLRNNGESARG